VRGLRLSANEYTGAQINFGDLTPFNQCLYVLHLQESKKAKKPLISRKFLQVSSFFATRPNKERSCKKGGQEWG
jgi:hypothetical protein